MLNVFRRYDMVRIVHTYFHSDASRVVKPDPLVVPVCIVRFLFVVKYQLPAIP